LCIISVVLQKHNKGQGNVMTEDGKRKQVQEIIAQIVLACEGRDAVFRGEPRQYEVPASSSIYRRYEGANVFNKHFGPADIEREIVDKARAVLYGPETPEMHILTELRHFGGDTNLVDFSEALLVALFFACNGEPDKDGRVFVLHKDRLGTQGDETIEFAPAARTEQSRGRVAAQNSIFVRPGKGHVDKGLMSEIRVPQGIKTACLEYIDRFHNIRQQTIYNDLAGFVENEENFASASVEFYKGNAKAALGKHGDAIEHFGKALRLRPEDHNAFYNRGNSKGALGEYEAAIGDYDEAIRLQPEYAEAFNNRGYSKAELGQHGEAIKDYDAAIRLHPDLAEAFTNRGVAKADLGQHGDAIGDYDEAIRLRPEDAQAFNNRGVAKAALGKYGEAIGDYDEAIRLHPDFAQAFNNRGNAKAALGQPAEAIGDHDAAIRLRSEDAQAFNNRGAAKSALRKHEEAIGDWDEAIRLRPEYPEAFTGRGTAKDALGKHGDAIKDHDEAIRLRPEYPTAFNNRGVAKAALGDLAGARADYARALDLAEGQGQADMATAIRKAIDDLGDDASPDP